MTVETPPADLAIDLRTYGEDEVADEIEQLAPEQLARIWERADHYVYAPEYARPSGASPLLAWALAMAAVEVVEGQQRELSRKRRKLKGIYPGY